ncbi:MAG TPA: ricin-type beta-trefoil lectin domain protein [Candidatus Acidoferrum sp.]|nr:ricin-type beta-trefoil lectin domain protein [Candidatus Acidoferrum sp.]
MTDQSGCGSEMAPAAHVPSRSIGGSRSRPRSAWGQRLAKSSPAIVLVLFLHGLSAAEPLGKAAAPVVGLADKCLDVDPAPKTPTGNTRVVLNTCNGGQSQQWERTWRSQLKHSATGTCLNAEGGQASNGTNLIVSPCSPSPQTNERWFWSDFTNSQGLAWQIIGAGSNRCVNVAGAKSADKSPLVLWDCTGGANDTWRVHQTAPIVGLVGKCLDVDLANKTPSGNARAIIRACNGSANQNWSYQSAKGQVVNGGTGLCLNVEQGLAANLSAVIAYQCSISPQPNEAWSVAAVPRSGATSYQFKGKGSGRCLNVPNAKRDDGTGLIIFDCVGADNDTWSLVTKFPSEIKVRAYALVNDDGVTNPTTMTLAQLQAVLDDMNKVYGRMGLWFSLASTDWIVTKNTLLNTIGISATPAQDAAARQLAAAHPGFLTLLLRRGGGAFSGFSNASDYVAAPNTGFNAGLVVHEFGHYFNLPHTFFESLSPGKDGDANYVAYQRWLGHDQNVKAFEADGISDTPPDPGPWVFERRWGLSQTPPTTDPLKIGFESCAGGDQIQITAPNGAVVVTPYPDRHNAMSYFKHCWPGTAQTFSALQLSRMDATLSVPARSHLLRQ